MAVRATSVAHHRARDGAPPVGGIERRHVRPGGLLARTLAPRVVDRGAVDTRPRGAVRPEMVEGTAKEARLQVWRFKKTARWSRASPKRHVCAYGRGYRRIGMPTWSMAPQKRHCQGIWSRVPQKRHAYMDEMVKACKICQGGSEVIECTAEEMCLLVWVIVRWCKGNHVFTRLSSKKTATLSSVPKKSHSHGHP